MAANLSPEYKDAEAAYRRARDPEERLLHLKEMLRTIPKHKGTEHLQADLKTRIKDLTEELSGPKKGGRGGHSVAVRPEGAAQVVLLGPPNAGKSSLHARLTGSGAEVGPYPFTTKRPLPGMLPFEDIQLQLIDLPPISVDFMDTWMPNALVHADAALLVVDINDPAAVDDVAAIRRKLAPKHVALVAAADTGQDEQEDDPFLRRLTTLLVVTKSDLLADPEAEIQVFQELAGAAFPSIAASVEAGAGLDRIGPRLFDLLGILRVYTKIPGHPPDRSRPFAMRRGDRVQDVARLVRPGLSGEVKSARIWGAGTFPGQQVARDHALVDGDIVELHF